MKHEPDQERNDFIKLVKIFKRNFLVIVLITSIAAILSVFYALSKPNIYKSEVKIHPGSSKQAGNIGALAGQFAGLAGLAGINLGGEGDANLIIGALKSREFIKKFIQRHDILIPLVAAEGWDSNSNQLTIDSDIYDEKTNEWVRKEDPPKLPKPSMEEAFEEFLEILSVSLDKKTQSITVSISFYSPEIAMSWASKLTADLSEYLRVKDELETQEAITFLQHEQENTEYVELQNVFSELLKEQYQKLTLTKIKKIYGFEIRDGAYIPEEKDKPKRAILVILLTFVGFILSIVLIFLRIFAREVINA